MRKLRSISFLAFTAMSLALIYGFTQGNFQQDGKMLLNNPWGIVSIVDLYSGFLLFSAWIYFREKSIFTAMLWIVFVMLMGFWAASLYSLVQSYLSENWVGFWMGARNAEANP